MQNFEASHAGTCRTLNDYNSSDIFRGLRKNLLFASDGFISRANLGQFGGWYSGNPLNKRRKLVTKAHRGCCKMNEWRAPAMRTWHLSSNTKSTHFRNSSFSNGWRNWIISVWTIQLSQSEQILPVSWKFICIMTDI